MKERNFISKNINKLLVTEYIRRETDTAGFGGMEMKRTPFGTNITLSVNKPGLVIGRHGSKVQEITETLEKKYGVESPQIEVKEVENPDLNPQVVARKIALSLEKGWSYRKAGNTSLRRIIDSGTRGVMIRIGGKISGERARSQKFMFGSIKYSGEPARSGMETGFSAAKLKLGIIGVSVKMLRNDYRLPDDITVKLQNNVSAENMPMEENEKDGTESEKAQRNE
ncbi:MAG: 30S ribosomal protein S3 [Thermoplasmataceae archaeon]|jgi:small subunit ribosomal protein S3